MMRLLNIRIQAMLVAVLLLTAIGSSASEQSASLRAALSDYQLTLIDLPESIIIPLGLANDETATGFYYDADFRGHGFIWRDGSLSPLDAPGWHNTQATGMNDRGQVVGVVDNGVFSPAGTGAAVFVYNSHHDSWAILPDIPGRPVANNSFVNNKGVVYGSSSRGDYSQLNDTVAWTWDGESYSFFTAPGASPSGLGTFSTGINDRGELTGFYQDDLGVFHGFLKTGSVITTIDVPGADSTQVFGLNNRGDIIGGYVIADQFHNFLLRNGEFYELPAPEGGVVFAISERGQYTGFYVDASGVFHGFVATPV